MAEDAYTTLVREIEVERGRMTAHEQVCAERYKGIVSSLDRVEKVVNALSTTVQNQPSTMSKWTIRGLIGVMSLMLSLVAWEAKQLYALEVVKPHAQAAAPWWQIGPQPTTN